MALGEEQRTKYRSDGCLIIPGGVAGLTPFLGVISELTALGKTFNPRFAFDRADCMLAMSDSDRGTFYRALRYLPSLARLGASEQMLELCRSLGLVFPALMRSFNIRMDLPYADRYLFHWHQDIPYLLGSFNSVTLWLPLGPADDLHGSIEVIPGSHKVLAPYRFTSEEASQKNAQLSPEDLRLDSEPATGGIVVRAGVGDVVVFSQLLVHRSTPNRSERCRWTAQLRYSDLMEPAFRAAGFPFGDMTTIARTRYLDERIQRR